MVSVNGIPILQPKHFWVCRHCGLEDMTTESKPHTRFHACAALGGLTMPMIRKDEKARVVLKEREDYVGDETVTTVEGRPIMAAITEREDGSNDVAVYAPVAKGKVGELG